MKPVVLCLRKNNIFSVIFLDDVLILANTKNTCTKNVKFCKDLLQSLGFILNTEKCNFHHKQICRFKVPKLKSTDLMINLPNDKKEIIQYNKLNNLSRAIWQWCERRNLYSLHILNL